MTLVDIRLKCATKYKTPVTVNKRTCTILNPAYNEELRQELKDALRNHYSDGDLVLCSNIDSLAGCNISKRHKEEYNYSFIVWDKSMSHLKWYTFAFKELNPLTKTL